MASIMVEISTLSHQESLCGEAYGRAAAGYHRLAHQYAQYCTAAHEMSLCLEYV